MRVNLRAPEGSRGLCVCLGVTQFVRTGCPALDGAAARPHKSAMQSTAHLPAGNIRCGIIIAIITG
jgi:hypothetical protein